MPRTRTNILLPPDAAAALYAYARQHRIAQSRLVDQALRGWLADHFPAVAVAAPHASLTVSIDSVLHASWQERHPPRPSLTEIVAGYLTHAGVWGTREARIAMVEIALRKHGLTPSHKATRFLAVRVGLIPTATAELAAPYPMPEDLDTFAAELVRYCTGSSDRALVAAWLEMWRRQQRSTHLRSAEMSVMEATPKDVLAEEAQVILSLIPDASSPAVVLSLAGLQRAGGIPEGAGEHLSGEVRTSVIDAAHRLAESAWRAFAAAREMSSPRWVLPPDLAVARLTPLWVAGLFATLRAVAEKVRGPQLTFLPERHNLSASLWYETALRVAEAREDYGDAMLTTLRSLCASTNLTDDDIRAAVDAMRQLGLTDLIAEFLQRVEEGDTAAQSAVVSMVVRCAAMARQRREDEARAATAAHPTVEEG